MRSGGPATNPENPREPLPAPPGVPASGFALQLAGVINPRAAEPIPSLGLRVWPVVGRCGEGRFWSRCRQGRARGNFFGLRAGRQVRHRRYSAPTMRYEPAGQRCEAGTKHQPATPAMVPATINRALDRHSAQGLLRSAGGCRGGVLAPPGGLHKRSHRPGGRRRRVRLSRPGAAAHGEVWRRHLEAARGPPG